MNYIFKNAAVFCNDSFTNVQIVTNSGKIKYMVPSSEKITLKNYTEIDCSGLVIIPGIIDVHIHSRLNGKGSHIETPESFLNSCVISGISKGICMANTEPSITSYKDVNVVNRIYRTWPIDIYQAATATEFMEGKKANNIDEIINVTKFLSDDGKSIDDINVFRDVLNKIENKDVFLFLHETSSDVNTRVVVSYENNKNDKYLYFGQEYETKILFRDLNEIKKRNCKVHFQHISTPKGLKAIYKAKKINKNITCEVTPHHLIFPNEEIDYSNGHLKMNPPLVPYSWQKKLIKYVNKGYADVIASDHAPHYLEDKSKKYYAAKNGVCGLETLFPSLYTFLVRKKLIKLKKIVELISVNPGKIFFNIDNTIKVGNDATFLIYDLNKEYKFTSDNIASNAKNYILKDKKLYGELIYFVKNGKILYNEKWKKQTVS